MAAEAGYVPRSQYQKGRAHAGILAGTYSDATAIFQETAGVFVKRAEEHDELGDRYFVAKSDRDPKRDQNSVLLLRRSVRTPLPVPAILHCCSRPCCAHGDPFRSDLLRFSSRVLPVLLRGVAKDHS